MKYDDKLTLTMQAEILIPRYNEFGKLEACCMEGDCEIGIELKPTALIELNLQLAGSSLRGARDSAALLLGTRTKVPVMMSRKYGVCWMPITWLDFPDRGWVNELQVLGYQPGQANTTQVYMKSGNVVHVPCSYYVFDGSMTKARDLRSQLDAREERIFKMPQRLVPQQYLPKGEGMTYEMTDNTSYVAEQGTTLYCPTERTDSHDLL